MFSCIDCPVFDPFEPDSEAAIECNVAISGDLERDLVFGFCRHDTPAGPPAGSASTATEPPLATWPVVNEIARCFPGVSVSRRENPYDFRIGAGGINRAFEYRRILNARGKAPRKDPTP